MTYTLYYAPQACSLSPHIALREAQLPFELSRLDFKNRKVASGEDFHAINPNGYVPAMRLPDGTVLTEGVAIVQYIADQKPEANLAPRWGTFERYRLIEWLNFIATELHKATAPFYNPAATDELKQSIRERVAKRLHHVANKLAPFVMGETFTVADGYLFYCLRAWQRQNNTLDDKLAAYYQRLAQRPSIAASLAAEGIEP
jgi:glutathione S-transferase